MTDLTVTAAKVGVVDPIKSIIQSYIAGATITKGQSVYIDASGTLQLTDANAGPLLAQFRGIALNGGAAGVAIDVIHEGELEGFTLTSMSYDDKVYLSATPGALATTYSSYPTVVGRVVPKSDQSKSKVLRVHTQWEADWTA